LRLFSAATPKKNSRAFGRVKTFFRFRAGIRHRIVRRILTLNFATIAEFRIDNNPPVCYKIDGSPVIMSRWTKEIVNKIFWKKQ